MLTEQARGAVEGHYAARAQPEAVLAAVRRALPPGRAPGIADLAPLDHFHVRGVEATDELARLAGVVAGMQVLDVGAGVGGPARHLAAKYGCTVTGIDLTAEYCRIADGLTDLVGLGDRVRFQTGDACTLPFPDGGFDLVWTQHVAMNIADRPRLYEEMHRVLRQAGKLALYDVVAGNGAEPHLPVPWAREAADSFLMQPGPTRTLLERCGFEILHWRDVTEAAKIWLAERSARPPAPPPLGLHLLLGPDFPRLAANLGRNIAEGRVGLLMAVARKPA